MLSCSNVTTVLILLHGVIFLFTVKAFFGKDPTHELLILILLIYFVALLSGKFCRPLFRKMPFMIFSPITLYLLASLDLALK